MATKRRKEYLGLFSEKCITCKHLVEHAKVDNRECHFTQGNVQCPAVEVKIVFVGEALMYARKVLAARDKRHAKTEARLMEYIGAQSQAFRTKFYEYLERGGKID